MIRVVPGVELSDERRRAIVELCDLAYGEPTGRLFAAMEPVAHVVALEGDAVVSHAMWVDRRLQVGESAPIRTAYVEFVATHPDRQGRGLATAVMERVETEIRGEYSLGALCPATAGIYERLGWRFWRGPLSVRWPSGGTTPTPDETVMMRVLDEGLELDWTAPLSVEWREGELW